MGQLHTFGCPLFCHVFTGLSTCPLLLRDAGQGPPVVHLCALTALLVPCSQDPKSGRCHSLTHAGSRPQFVHRQNRAPRSKDRPISFSLRNPNNPLSVPHFPRLDNSGPNHLHRWGCVRTACAGEFCAGHTWMEWGLTI